MKTHKRDIILFISIIGVATLLWGGMTIFKNVSGKDADQVVITIDGKEYGTYSLYEDRVVEITDIDSHDYFGKNTVEIKNGEVNMTYADCPDQYCVKHNPINNSSETIVCLPHKLVVELTKKNENTDSLDVVVE